MTNEQEDLFCLFFLASKDALEKFERNFDEEWYWEGDCLTNRSFSWVKAKEGICFWRDLDHEFRRELRDMCSETYERWVSEELKEKHERANELIRESILILSEFVSYDDYIEKANEFK